MLYLKMGFGITLMLRIIRLAWRIRRIAAELL